MDCERGGGALRRCALSRWVRPTLALSMVFGPHVDARHVQVDGGELGWER
jgi:hypothetical protein